MGGVERQRSDSSFVSAFRKYFISGEIDQILAGGAADRTNGGTAWIAARQNYFSRINYAYQDKYLLEFVGRYDGSYIFPTSKRFSFFPAVSAGWRISQEPFFRRYAPIFDELKLRASCGQTGDHRIVVGQHQVTYEVGR